MMMRLKRAVFTHNNRMKALEKLCVSDTDKAADILDERELNAVKSSLPKWKEGTKYDTGCAVLYDNLVYKCIQAHTSLSSWIPKDTPTLWEVVFPQYEGTVYDPIPAVSGLRYFKDKYYLENGVLYLCVRDDTGSGTVLYAPISDLVDDYFTEVK